MLAGARPTDHSSSRKDGEVDEGADGVRASESGVVLPRGAGAVAIFDETTDAIRAVLDIRKAVRPLGVELRSGVHFGHCWQADEKCAGADVHIGARLASAASPGEILISEEAAEQAHRVGIEVEDRGVRSLKGLPGRRRVFGVSVG